MSQKNVSNKIDRNISKKELIEKEKLIEKETSSKKGEEFEYDKIPYTSYPFHYAYPSHIRAIATLFGLNPPKLETARVLELGSSSGENSMPFAFNYPKSECVAIDLSKVEIKEGQKRLSTLGIKNLDLKVANILDIDDSWGKFDYIYAHGIYSWVPKIVSEKILDISKNNLSPNGIAYVSYNIKPGWNMGMTIRDMMTFHTSNLSNVQEQIQQARAFVNFISSILEGSNSPYAQYLKLEALSISQKTDSYIYGEYLVEHNSQEYFKDFVAKIRKKGLEYLADAHLASMYLYNLPPKAVEKLKDVKDLVLTEQYMDFVSNKRFRCTLMCNKDNKINRKLESKSLEKLKFTFNIVPEKSFDEIDIEDNLEVCTFYFQNNKAQKFTITNVILKAIFYVFSENLGYQLSINNIAKLAMKKIKKVQLQDIKKELNNSLLNLIFQGYVRVCSEDPLNINNISDKPKVSYLVKNQIKHLDINSNLWVTSQLNEIVVISHFEYHLLQYLDGKHTKKDLLDKLLKIEDVKIHKEGKEITDIKEKTNIYKEQINLSLDKFKKSSLLIS